MSDEAVYRTAPATPGLLIRNIKAIEDMNTGPAWTVQLPPFR